MKKTAPVRSLVPFLFRLRFSSRSIDVVTSIVSYFYKGQSINHIIVLFVLVDLCQQITYRVSSSCNLMYSLVRYRNNKK